MGGFIKKLINYK
ncbi:hypothetical protein EFN12_07070 [Pediococcus pentosaceus]|nr:hypothetical protein [Pediococcus pentosaceus]MBY4582715.1 hypothetical protein [Pediococcus pentosaceus]MCE5960626.1 hypothetical protein [Pediococcus pentosaceus]MCS8568328.1 hypothetical protein [Pediococcus pentosaceus]MCT3022743.1 hypothetical protein [Pediococcus pentosaceus]